MAFRNQTRGTMTSEPGFSDRFYTSSDGLQLHLRLYGEGNNTAEPVICLPGLTRNARDFHELALYLSRHAETPHKVVAFDYRGRGRSAFDRNWQNYNIQITDTNSNVIWLLDGDRVRDYYGETYYGWEKCTENGNETENLRVNIILPQEPVRVTVTFFDDNDYHLRTYAGTF